MKREGFSLNAIKFFHFTAFPVDSFSSLGAQSLQRNSVFKMGRQGAWRGGCWGGGGLAGCKQEGGPATGGKMLEEMLLLVNHSGGGSSG